jgi:hypothetical protein
MNEQGVPPERMGRLIAGKMHEMRRATSPAWQRLAQQLLDI